MRARCCSTSVRAWRRRSSASAWAWATRSSASAFICSMRLAASALLCSACCLACASSSCARLTRFSASIVRRPMRSSASTLARSTRALALDCSWATAASVSFRSPSTSPSASISSSLIRCWALAQLARQLVRQRHGAVAVLIRGIRGLLQLGHEGGVGRIEVLGRGRSRRKVTHDCRCPNCDARDPWRNAQAGHHSREAGGRVVRGWRLRSGVRPATAAVPATAQ